MGLDVSGYGIVRSLADEGVPIVGLWRREDEAGRLSRYCTAIRVAPDSDERWIETILALARRYDHPALFPSNDRYAELLARHRAVLEGPCRFHWVDEALIGAVLDKARIGVVCRQAGLPLPRTHLPEGPDISMQAAAFAFPCLVKPRTGFRIALPAGAKVIVCRDAAQLTALYRRAPHLTGVTVWQEIIEGGDPDVLQGTALCVRPGEVAAIACMRKIRQHPMGYGITSLGRTEYVAEVVLQTAQLVAALQWRGIASAEFKRSARDGRYYFIELNPRMPWYNVLFRDAGINLAYVAWCDLMNEPPPDTRQTDGVRWISLANDATTSWRRWRDGSLSPWQWLRSVAGAQSFSWYEAADPEPALGTAVRLSGLVAARRLRALQSFS